MRTPTIRQESEPNDGLSAFSALPAFSAVA